MASLAPIIPAISFIGIGSCLYFNPIVCAASYLFAHYVPKILSNNIELKGFSFNYEKCNLAVARGEWHMLTSWNKITECGVTYILDSNTPAQQLIINLLMKLDNRTYIHDPATLFDAVVKEVDINPYCFENEIRPICIGNKESDEIITTIPSDLGLEKL
jgi:hypothetical protein